MSENSGINGNSTNQGNNFIDTLLQMRTGLMTNISEIHFGDGRMDKKNSTTYFGIAFCPASL